MITCVIDGRPLAEGLDDGQDQKDTDFYKQQAKLLFKNLSKGHHEASRMSIETWPYYFQYPCGLCLSRSIGDQDVGEFIIPDPYVKQIKLSNAGGRLIISSDGVWDALIAEMTFKCARGLPPEAAAEQIVKEAVEAKGLRDDTTCIVIDIISPYKPKRTIQSQRTPGKGLVLLKNFFLRKTTSDSLTLPDEDNYPEPDLEEVFEDGCPSLSRRYHWNSVFSLTNNDLVAPEKEGVMIPQSVKCAGSGTWNHQAEKMAAILLSLDLNKRRGCPLYNYEKEVNTGNPYDVEILDIPTNPKKRKLLHVLDDNEVVFEDEEGPITQTDLQRWFVDDWDKRTPVKVSTDGCTNDFLMAGLSTKDMPVTKADLIDVLCDYIMAIQDDMALEMTWV
ncbi:putative protein phosphatase 2C 40 [Zea mays]|uniref:protein-serine/threonine phosphatase n=1 Tax=Zea mays TaxID=4577 RepID=A0A3L6FC61_MAIZE|nr:putative protein phosphatase 2C 40 [Zea mays]